MKRYTQSTLVRIVSVGFGLWLLIALITNKPARFTENQLELILGAFIVVFIVISFLWFAYYKHKIKIKKDSYPKNVK